MQISRFGLGTTLILAAATSVCGVSFADVVAEKAVPSVTEQAPMRINPIVGTIKEIDEATQTIKVGQYKLKVVNGALERGDEIIFSISITLNTEIAREERNVTATELKVGDFVSEIGIKGHVASFPSLSITPVVVSIEPLKLHLDNKNIKLTNMLGGSDTVTVEQKEDSSTITVVKPEEVTFVRSTEIDFSDLIVGQYVMVYPTAQVDDSKKEKIEATSVAVDVTKARRK